MNRRKFFKDAAGLVAVAVSAPALAVMLKPSLSQAEEPRRRKEPEVLDPKDPAASALGYVADAKTKKEAAGKKCANCTMFVAGQKGTGTCQIFPGKLVNANGYCNAYVKKA
jgi:hypothetical protein